MFVQPRNTPLPTRSACRLRSAIFSGRPGSRRPDFRDLKRRRIDSIACLNVLEHIEKQEDVLRNMWQILPPGGRVALMVPAFESLYGEIDARLGHYRRYTLRSLLAVAESAGFILRRLRYMNVVGFFGWWANAKILRSRNIRSPFLIPGSYPFSPASRIGFPRRSGSQL
jgi:SAM-dependent methyltransferase